jgi:hypothetical protein
MRRETLQTFIQMKIREIIALSKNSENLHCHAATLEKKVSDFPQPGCYEPFFAVYTK